MGCRGISFFFPSRFPPPSLPRSLGPRACKLAVQSGIPTYMGLSAVCCLLSVVCRIVRQVHQGPKVLQVKANPDAGSDLSLAYRGADYLADT